MSEQYAYSTDLSEIVADYREARRAYTEVASAAHHAAIAMGCEGIYSTGNAFGPPVLVGLATSDKENGPEGWVWSRARNMLLPRRGKAGDAARAWLSAHQLPKQDARGVLAEHGLPRNSKVPSRPRDGAFDVLLPTLFEHEGVVWALYTGKPGSWTGQGEVSAAWTPRRLSEYYAAKESVESAAEPVVAL